MKNLNRNRILFLLPTVALGAVSLLVYRYMMDTCFDEKGLLVLWNIPSIVLMLIGAAFAIYLLVMSRTLGGSVTYDQAFPRCLLSGCLVLAGAAELYLCIQAELMPTGWELYFYLATVAAMAITGLMRIFGKRPWFIFNGIVCLFFMYRMICNYRIWSSDPQIQDYAYQMTACSMLTLAAFHRTCCDAGIIDRKRLVVTALAAAFCCIVSLNDNNFVFYLSSGLWAAGSLCSLGQLPQEEPRELAPTPDPEPQPETLDDLIADARKMMGDV